MLTITCTNELARTGSWQRRRSTGCEPNATFGPQPSDQVLIEAVGRGDQSSMSLLYARHKLRVYRFILRMVGDESVAEDILSDVFLEAWRDADTFKGKSQVSTWLLAIARHRALSRFRRRIDARLDDQSAAAIQDPADGPELEIQRKDRSTIIKNCLSQLSDIHREVVDLVYYREKTIEEVARITGVPVATVKTRMFHARQRMGRLLGAVGVDSPMLH